MPVPEPSSATETNVVLKVGVAPDGMLKQQVVHAYKTRELKEHKLVVRAGASLDILESEGKASRVHFSTKAWTPDYKTEIPQNDASGWIATKDIVKIETKQEKPNKGYYVDDKVQWLRRTASLQAVTYVDMFARNYMTQRPLLCGKDRYYPLGTDMVFKHSETRDEFHVVFPKGVALPGKSELSDPLTLYGHFETIKTTPDGEALDEPAKPAKGSLLGYRYFVVSRWELHK